MAQIDLKKCTFKIKDGYTKTGAVNNMSGHAQNATVITVDGFTGAVVTGDYLKFAGHTTEYLITAHSETLGNTTSITISPGLTAAVADNEVITLQPHRVEMKIGDGTFQWTEKVNRIYVKDRGKLSSVRDGEEEPVEIKFEFIWEYLKADTSKPITIEDALKKRGEAAAWVTADADTCAPYSVDLEIEFDPLCTADKNEIYLIQDFRYETLEHDFKQGMVSCSGKANIVEATVTRV